MLKAVTMNPILVELKAELKTARAKVYALEQSLDKAQRAIVEPVLVGAPESYDLIFGDWECPSSPTGFCVYDDEEDHCHDDCLFCHDPEERK